MADPHERPLRLASYNIRAALGTDLRRDPDRILGAIDALGADFVILQEADHQMGARPSALPQSLLRDRTGLSPLPIADHEPGLGWHGIAMLARDDIVVQDIHRIALPGLEPRGAVFADMDTRAGPLRIAGVHLGLMRRSRRAQLLRIRRELDALSDRPTIIMGDFNEWSRTRGLGGLARDYTLLTPGRTFPARLPLLPLDRIAHCHQLSARMFPPQTADHPHPSDHLPVITEIWPNSARTPLEYGLAGPEGLEPSTC